MSLEVTRCKNHPDVEARRKCYQCLAAICPKCQRRAIGHIFCSRTCQARCWVSDRLTRLSRLSLRLSLRFRKAEKAVSRVTGSGIMRLVTIALLLVVLGQVITLIHQVEDIAPPVSKGPGDLMPPTMTLIPGQGYLTVAGSAPGFAVAVLSADGREVDTCTVQEGSFSFTFQPEGGTRSLQVQVFGDGVPTLYSRSHPVPDLVAGGGERAPERGLTTGIAAIQESGKIKETSATEPVPGIASLPEPMRPAVGRGNRKVTSLRPGNRNVKPRAGEREPGIPTGDLLADLSRGADDSRLVAITFDGGSFDGSTDEILQVLETRGLKATFFLTGEFMRRFPEATREITRKGHEVGNHTFSHLHLTTFERNLRHDTLPGISREILLEELTKNEALFRELTGREMIKLWRAPYGEQNAEIRGWAAAAGYRHVSWTFDPETRLSLDALDWVSDPGSALYLTSSQIVHKLLSFDSRTKGGMGGGIMLMHLGSERQDQLHGKLGQLIDQIQDRGYKVGSVTELINGPGG